MYKKKEDEQRAGGGLVPKTKVRVGPDRRAQAVLRAAERPKETRTGGHGGVKTTTTTIKNPGVGVEATKRTRSTKDVKGTDSTLGFNRYKPGNTNTAPYATKKQTTGYGKPPSKTADGLHKDRLRSAAVKHAMGRQMTDIRPGGRVSAATVLTASGKNPRGRAYEQQTNGALNYERGKKDHAESTKLTKNTWQPSNTNKPVKFNPNDLKNALKAMAEGTVVRATTKLIGGPYAQAASMIDDLAAAATGKRPSKQVSKAHTKQQSKLINDLQIKKKKQAPWAGSGPF